MLHEGKSLITNFIVHPSLFSLSYTKQILELKNPTNPHNGNIRRIQNISDLCIYLNGFPIFFIKMLSTIRAFYTTHCVTFEPLMSKRNVEITTIKCVYNAANLINFYTSVTFVLFKKTFSEISSALFVTNKTLVIAHMLNGILQ